MKVLLIAYDQGDLIGWFQQSLAAVASGPAAQGAWVRDYNISKDFDARELTRYLNLYHFDVVGISSCAGYWQYARCKEIAEAVNKSNSRKKFWFIAGGPMFTATPEYFLNKFKLDSIIKGDGELFHEPPYEKIEDLGIGKLNDYNMPAYSLFNIDHYRLMRMPHIGKNEYCLPILSSRGCTNACSFCYRQEKGIRLRSIKSVVDEIEHLKKYYNITYFAFADELALASPSRSAKLAEALIPLNIKWSANGRLDNISSEVLTILKKSGLMFINYGVESFDNELLEQMGKNLTTDQIKDGIEATLAAGITPGINIIWGFPNDTPEKLEKSLAFLMEYDDGTQLRTIRSVCPYPGSALYDLAIHQGKLRT